MSIENLKKTLESEKDLVFLDWLFPKKLNIKNRDEAIKNINYKRRLDYEAYIVGYEAATNRLLPLLQKAVEMAEFYGNRTITISYEQKDGTFKTESMTNAFTQKANEFLSSIKRSIL